METRTIVWIILGFISVISLIYTFVVGKNSIWSGCLVGIFIGLILAARYYFQGAGFDWLILVKGGITGSMAGIVFSFFAKK